MLQHPQASRLFAAVLLAPMAVLPATPVLAAGAKAQPAAEPEASELAQLRFPRLRMPSVPRMPKVFAITPERRALLNTIRYAEGTWKEGADIGGISTLLVCEESGRSALVESAHLEL